MNTAEVIIPEAGVFLLATTALGGHYLCRASSATRDAAEKIAAALQKAVEKNWVALDFKAAVTKPDGRYSAKLLATEATPEPAAEGGGEETIPAHLQDGYAGHASGGGQ